MKQLDKGARFQTPTVAAKIMGIGRDTIYAGCKNGTIPHVKVRNDYRIDMEEWGRMLTEQSRNNLRKDGENNADRP